MKSRSGNGTRKPEKHGHSFLEEGIPQLSYHALFIAKDQV